MLVRYDSLKRQTWSVILKSKRSLLNQYGIRFMNNAGNHNSLPPLDLTVPPRRDLDPNSPLDTSLFFKNFNLIGARIKAAQTSDFLNAPELKGYFISVL